MSRLSIKGLEQQVDRLRALGGLPEQALAGAAEDVEEGFALAASKHNHKGNLVASVTKRRTGDAWEVFHDLQRAPHALFVHWGTKPHVIKPRDKKALRWPGPGGFVFAKGVRHPGYKGDPWAVNQAALAPAAFARHVSAQIAQLNKG